MIYEPISARLFIMNIATSNIQIGETIIKSDNIYTSGFVMDVDYKSGD